MSGKVVIRKPIKFHQEGHRVIYDEPVVMTQWDSIETEEEWSAKGYRVLSVTLVTCHRKHRKKV